MTQLIPPPQNDTPAPRTRLSSLGKFFAGYVWLILKNVIGWALILVSPAVGFTLPGPGGIPLFLIGFALITFPGKRKMTARVLRGKQMDLEKPVFNVIEIVAAFLVPLILVWPGVKWLWAHVDREAHVLSTAWYVAIGMVAVAISWLLAVFALRGLNLVIRFMPILRRKVRPWLRKRGILLLPPRYRERNLMHDARTDSIVSSGGVNDEILEIHQRHRERAKSAWQHAKPWLRRGFGVVITAWILWIMFKPIARDWNLVKSEIHSINWGRFIAASGMFSVFLFFFRAISWRRVLKGFGYRLPVWVAVRIWSTSEMARYLPGAIWQVVGRWMLLRPYGVSSVISTTSQILELCIFVFANVLLSMSCLLWFAAKVNHGGSYARIALIGAMCLTPALALLLHPKIFYGMANRVLRWIGKPLIVTRLRGAKLVKLLIWDAAGLLWQSLAVFLIAQPVLHLKLDWWWIAAAAYCLAWIGGFFAFWAPAGFGVREVVFMQVIIAIAPVSIRQDPTAFEATAVFLGLLLRLWTIVGELMLWGVSTMADWRGARNYADAPGRLAELSTASYNSPNASQRSSSPTERPAL